MKIQIMNIRYHHGKNAKLESEKIPTIMEKIEHHHIEYYHEKNLHNVCHE